MGEVRTAAGERYEFTFNTWGYVWPKEWGTCPTREQDPQRFGKNAYSGLLVFQALKHYIAKADGHVHFVEMGCGTGAGAHHIAKTLLPQCTYEAVDMQAAAIQTCRQRFVPELGGRLVATRADCTAMPIAAQSADVVVVCETHVTEIGGTVTDEDRLFWLSAHRLLRPGGFIVWGNAIPATTWTPCFNFLESLGMKRIDDRDVTSDAVVARDLDEDRINAYVEQCLDRFLGFRIPKLGPRKRLEASLALKNFARNPGTRLYEDLRTRADTYHVVCLQKLI
jgi:SAM-dependent methyltransferase